MHLIEGGESCAFQNYCVAVSQSIRTTTRLHSRWPQLNQPPPPGSSQKPLSEAGRPLRNSGTPIAICRRSALTWSGVGVELVVLMSERARPHIEVDASVGSVGIRLDCHTLKCKWSTCLVGLLHNSRARARARAIARVQARVTLRVRVRARVRVRVIIGLELGLGLGSGLGLG